MPRSCGVRIGRGGGVAGAIARGGLCSTGKVGAIWWPFHIPSGHFCTINMNKTYSRVRGTDCCIALQASFFSPAGTLLISLSRTSGTWYLYLNRGTSTIHRCLPGSFSLLTPWSLLGYWLFSAWLLPCLPCLPPAYCLAASPILLLTAHAHGAGGGAQPESPRVLSDIGHGRDRAGGLVTASGVALTGDRCCACVAYRHKLIT